MAPVPPRTPRIPPLEPPYDADVARTLERMMPPGAYLLNFGTLDPLDREILIHRTCARCGSEYEWGVHVVVFGRPLGLSEEQIASTVSGGPDDPVWSSRQSLLIRLADELHETATVSDELWEAYRPTGTAGSSSS
jgi:4-carboxymuconolactone decarboxylase